MTSLAVLQSEFKAYLLSGDTAVRTKVIETAVLGATDRLHIYSSGYRERLIEALRNDFPALCGYLGEAQWRALCEGYVRVHPSRSFTLREFGSHLPVYAARENAAGNPHFAAELARFEWAFVEAFDAPDALALGVEGLARVPAAAWPQLTFERHPSVISIGIRFNTPALWSAIKEDATPPALAEFAEAHGCVVWRQGLATVFRAMPPDEYRAWGALASGSNFAEICEALLGWHGATEIPMRSASLLRLWTTLGLIADVSAPNVGAESLAVVSADRTRDIK